MRTHPLSRVIAIHVERQSQEIFESNRYKCVVDPTATPSHVKAVCNLGGPQGRHRSSLGYETADEFDRKTVALIRKKRCQRRRGIEYEAQYRLPFSR